MSAAAAGFVPVYRPGASALHAARAGVSAAYCGALALTAVLFEHPVVLAATLLAVLAAARGAGVGEELRRAARLSLPLALVIALVNPLVSREGETLLVRGWEILGRRFDVTLEALAFGAAFGLRLFTLMMAFALFSAAVDPDQLLKLMRRVSPRSALTVSLSTRLVPVLARDASRLNDAARCRRTPPSRAAVARAAVRGALDRAVDVAAALEVRGYGSTGRLRHARPAWSRHDVRVAGTAAAVAAIAVAAKATGVGAFTPYPTLQLAFGPAELLLGLVLVALAAVPFAGSAGRLGVARA